MHLAMIGPIQLLTAYLVVSCGQMVSLSAMTMPEGIIWYWEDLAPQRIRSAFTSVSQALGRNSKHVQFLTQNM